MRRTLAATGSTCAGGCCRGLTCGARAGWNRAVLDQLQKILEPEAEEDFARKHKRL